MRVEGMSGGQGAPAQGGGGSFSQKFKASALGKVAELKAVTEELKNEGLTEAVGFYLDILNSSRDQEFYIGYFDSD